MTKELVYKGAQEIGTFNGNTALSIISSLQILVDKYGPTTTLEHEYSGIYDVYHWREETDAEEYRRIFVNLTSKNSNEQHERSMLAELKAKYGE
jgi:hypothetical protein